MKLTIINPSKAYVHASPEEMDDLRKELSYTNTSEAHALKRLYNNHWFRSKNKEGWEAAINQTKSKVKRTLVYEDEGGTWIRPGSIPYIKTRIEVIVDAMELPRCFPNLKMIAWEKKLPFDLHPYQEEGWRELIHAKHGNVELTTGSGKSAIILKLCREMGLKTAIVAPNKIIFYELLKKFEYHLGKGKVGTFGDGKKKIGKLFTVCISDSLCNIKRDTKEWDFFSSLDCLIVDESHTFGAETLEEICFGVLADIPYRFFFSGTQTRGDGGEKLLQSIIGRTVHTLTTKEAVDGGYICPHDFKIVNIESSNPNFNDSDALEMKRNHFLKNKNICAFIARIANTLTTLQPKQQMLVLVEELEQISMLTKLLKVPYAYAHSEKKPERLAELGLIKVSSDECVELFNRGRVNVLIGTSCIATGTNIFPTNHTINWVGGASEIRTKQGAVGRSVRLASHNPWMDSCGPKDKAIIWDFNVFDVIIMGKHLEERLGYYKESGSKIEFVNLKK
jgi:superfamily II DNA or RNA helicase